MRVKGIILMMMIVMGCNSGGVSGEESGENRFLRSLVNVSEEFLNVFTSFGEMVGSVLGLNVNSKKSDVGKYFKTVQGTVEGVKTGLNKIVNDMKAEKNPNAEATETVVKTLVESKLDKIIEGAKTASEAIGDANVLIGNVAAGGANAAAGVSGSEIDNLVKGIKEIVDVVLKGVGKADAGDDKKAEDGFTSRAVGSGAGKLFANDNAGANANDVKKVASDASKAVGAVTGADILQAIVKNGSSLATDAAKANAKDGTIAGAIALRAIAKGGKFANTSAAATADVVTVVTGVALSAVTKALDTLTVGIRKTIDLGLKEVKETMKINASANPTISVNSSSESNK
ncbi:Variable outer membrane protein (plasmid) [Borrelia crocidurae DOU]|uniref:Variable large protein n=1 Tax=Borrelia crocidurae DOU TaxID=1293575 RepID=W5SKT8_9SPIR|nr:variable large family protein [Borrelia crocidurae]AHH07532.1 Variable outer membrane protein [Borrelia crocidurae DOU]